MELIGQAVAEAVAEGFERIGAGVLQILDVDRGGKGVGGEVELRARAGQFRPVEQQRRFEKEEMAFAGRQWKDSEIGSAGEGDFRKREETADGQSLDGKEVFAGSHFVEVEVCGDPLVECEADLGFPGERKGEGPDFPEKERFEGRVFAPEVPPEFVFFGKEGAERVEVEGKSFELDVAMLCEIGFLLGR